ncbi:MAG: GspH/FimT family pseudopilin [Thermodesulfobacteriota bacterium]
MKSKNNNRGFTIVELIVTMAIIAVILGITVPTILSGTSKTALKRTARDVTVELKAARQLAISRNMQFRVFFTLGTTNTINREYRVNTSSAWQTDPVRSTRTMDSRVDITSPVTSPSTFSVTFNPNGSATATEICIQNLSDSSDRKKVQVYNITGRVEILNAC